MVSAPPCPNFAKSRAVRLLLLIFSKRDFLGPISWIPRHNFSCDKEGEIILSYCFFSILHLEMVACLVLQLLLLVTEHGISTFHSSDECSRSPGLYILSSEGHHVTYVLKLTLF